jgi:hypothetical protein
MWPTHCVQYTWGAKFHAKLDVRGADFIVNKGMNKGVDSYSGFFDNSKASETPLHRCPARSRRLPPAALRACDPRVCSVFVAAAAAAAARSAASSVHCGHTAREREGGRVGGRGRVGETFRRKQAGRD